MVGVSGVRSTKMEWGRVTCWALYDFANSPYSTIMTTLGFPLFFLAVVVPGRSGPLIWGLLYGVSEVAAAALSPGLGAWSDQWNRRKPFLIGFSLLAIAGTALCSFLSEGDWVTAWIFFGLANVGFACANVFYNALLVDVAPPGRMETVSGIGWGTGYLGGLLGMLLAIPLYRAGVGADNIHNVHVSFLLVAGVFLLFSIPIFLLKERGAAAVPASGGLVAAYKRVWETLKAIRRYRNLFWFLLANFFFNDGLNTVILFAGAYGKEILHLATTQIFLLFVYLQIVAAAGAYLVGWVADRLGSRKTLLALVGSWVFLTVGLASVQSYPQFVVVACVAGFLLGPTQSVARGFLARLAPRDMEGEFYGFFGMAGKVAALIGPVLFGGVTSLSGSMRLGALSMIPMFGLGWFFLWRVREDRA